MTAPARPIPPDPDELLFPPSGKGRTISFAGSPPVEYRNLTIKGKRTIQDTDDDGNPAFWEKSGQPRWVIIYTVQLPPGFTPNPEIAEANNGEDDGVRQWWVKVAWRPDLDTPTAYMAVQAAVKRVHQRAIDLGGSFDRIAYTHDGPKAPGASPKDSKPKGFHVDYSPAPEGYVPETPSAPPAGNGQGGYTKRPQREDPYANVPPPTSAPPAYDDEPPF